MRLAHIWPITGSHPFHDATVSDLHVFLDMCQRAFVSGRYAHGAAPAHAGRDRERGDGSAPALLRHRGALRTAADRGVEGLASARLRVSEAPPDRPVLGLLLEIEERQRTGAPIDRLGETLLAAGALDRVLVISFDHPSLVRARSRIPGLRMEFVTHARNVDPVAMARRAAAGPGAIEWDMFVP